MAHVEHHAINAIAAAIGEENVRVDPDSCAYYASDLFFSPASPPLAVATPTNRDAAARAVRIAADEGLAIVPRGGGLSYTGGYVPQEARSIILDTSRLSHIVEINEDDLFATVEAGVTWYTLDDVLRTRDLRVPHFGPASGRVSTIGGGLSQNTILFGSAQYGTAADNVLGLEVALADGSRVKTGSGAMVGGAPFFRHHGPDLTGLFLGDGGALGVKLSANLRLMRRPRSFGYLSFSYPTFEAMLAAVCEVGRSGLAADVMGMGNYVPPKGPETGGEPAIHIVVEGTSEPDTAARLDRLRGICRHQGTEVEPVVSRLLRSDPFGFVSSLLDEQGRLQSWTHGVVPHTKVLHTFSSLAAFFNAASASIARHGIAITISAAVVGTAVLLEPVIRWRDRPSDLHLRGFGGAPAEWSGEADAGATEAVRELRRGLRDVFLRETAAHLQIGKFYAYREGLSDDALSLMHRVKHALDPHDRMNPGVLGLG